MISGLSLSFRNIFFLKFTDFVSFFTMNKYNSPFFTNNLHELPEVIDTDPN